MTRIFEVEFEAKIGGKWSKNWSRRNVVADTAREAIEKAEKAENAEVITDEGEKPVPFQARATGVKLIAEAR